MLRKYPKIFMYLTVVVLFLNSLFLSTIPVSAETGKWSDHAATAYASGNGTESDPFLISSAEQLAYMAKSTSFNNKYFQLAADINLSAYDWIPIVGFNGNFDGNGKTISGLKIGTEETPSQAPNDIASVGLFATVLEGGVVKNLTVDVSIYISDDKNTTAGIGGIVGTLQGTLDGCTAKGQVYGKRPQAYVGGVVGCARFGATIQNCANEATVSGGTETTAAYIGGIAGYTVIGSSHTANVQIANCYNVGTIIAVQSTKTPCVGGISGYVQNNSSSGKIVSIYNCYNNGIVKKESDGINAKLGNIAATLYVTNEAPVNTSNLYGIAGLTHDAISCTTTTDMTTSAFAEELTTNAKNLVSAGSCSNLLGWTVNQGKVVFDTNVVSEEEIPAETGKWSDHAATAYASGNGTESDPFLISSAEQLAYMAKSSIENSFGNKYFLLTDNIDLSDYDWVPIENFKGIFDGNGKTISGLKIGTKETPVQTPDGKASAGLFGMVIEGGVVKNLTVDASIYISDNKENSAGIGGIVGTLRGTLDGCTAKGQIYGKRVNAFVGGVAGYVSYGGIIRNCANEATVTGGTTNNVARIGGIAGYTVIGKTHEGDVQIANCYNVGTIIAASGTGPNAGGISGVVQNSSTLGKSVGIYNCYNSGTIKKESEAINAKLGNIAATIIETAPKTANLYGIAGLPNDAISCTTTTDMTNLAFAEDMTIYADALVGNETCSNLLGWTVKSGRVEFDTDYVEGKLALLNVAVTPSRMGSVVIKVDEEGGTNYVELAKKAINKGSNVQLTINPVSGCKLSELTLNGHAQNVTNNIFEFSISEATDINIQFEVESTVAVDGIYVNPAVETEGIGTESSPFKTLASAQEKLREVLVSQPNADITVYLMGDTYRLDETLKLTELDSSLGRVVFRNDGGNSPVITSGHMTGTFTKVSDKEYYSYQLPDTDKVNGKWPEFRDLYVNGEKANLARTKDLTFKYSYDNEVFKTNSTSIIRCDNSLYVSKEVLDGVLDTELTGVEIGQLVEWKSQIFHIASRDLSNVKDGEVNISINADQWEEYLTYDLNIKSLTGRTYWLQNHLSFLDEPGEFYYDRANGIIYYYPYVGQSMDTAVIEYAILDKLIELDHASNITFDGIEFTGTTANWINENGMHGMQGGSQYGYNLNKGWGDCGEHVPCAAIYGDYAEGIEILNCKFEELGGSAVVFQYGTKNLKVVGNVVRNLALAGIQVGVAQTKWNQDGVPGNSIDVTINNNYITNVGQLVYCVSAIGVKRCENLTINYNKIVHVPYAGITAGWGFATSADADKNKNLVNTEIAYNYIEDFLYKINDGGAIYTNGANAPVDNSDAINYIHHNYLRGGAHKGGYTGIYHDGSASNWLTSNNFIDDIRSSFGPVFFQDNVSTQYTHNITAKDNYTTTSMITQSGANDASGISRNIVLENNTMFADRSQINEAAKAIMDGAGLQENYKNLENPMDTEMRIADASMHYEVNKKQTENTKIKFELTNYSSTDKSYTISVADVLPPGITLVVNNNDDVVVDVGETKIVEAEFVITDIDKVIDTEDYVVGLVVKDSTGRTVSYPRTFTIKTLSGNVSSEIPYGTPVIDGILDEAYKQGGMNFYGNVFYPDANHESDITGGYYLLWDEQYLYCYVIVNESTVMSPGTAWIQEHRDKGTLEKLWTSDAIETYLKTSGIKSGNTKYAVDAFGIQRFGDKNIIDIHNELPYKTRFTYQGEIVDTETPQVIEAGQTATAALGTNVDGYVIEMTLPIKLVDTILTSSDGVPSAGDTIDFYVQNNDYRGTMENGSFYVVAQKNVMSTYTLKAKEVEDTIEFEVNNLGGSTSGVTVVGPTGGWVEGTNTFTVSSGDACVVAVKNADGSYSRVKAVATETNGVYSYTVEGMAGSTEIVVALSGDANGDGKVSNADITKLRAACAGKATLEGIQTLLGDVNGNGELTNADITRLRAACAGKKALNW